MPRFPLLLFFYTSAVFQKPLLCLSKCLTWNKEHVLQKTLLLQRFSFLSHGILKSLHLKLLWASVTQDKERKGVTEQGGKCFAFCRRVRPWQLVRLVLRAFWCRSYVGGVRCQLESEWTSEEYNADNRQNGLSRGELQSDQNFSWEYRESFPNEECSVAFLARNRGIQRQVPDGNTFSDYTYAFCSIPNKVCCAFQSMKQ